MTLWLRWAEEPELIERFGDGYRDYRRRVPAFFNFDPRTWGTLWRFLIMGKWDEKMNTQTRKWVAGGLLAAGVGIALLYAASRIVPKMMRGTMRSMMKEMMSGEGECNPAEMWKRMCADSWNPKNVHGGLGLIERFGEG
jgi:hypothetical protein